MQTTLKASYTTHYRRGLIRLLDTLEFRSSSAHQPVIEALKLIRRFAGAGNITYFPLGEVIPMHHALRGEWEDVLYREDARGRRRVVRMVYEVATFQALREVLRCKEFVLCLRILQSALVYVTTLMLQDVLADPAWADLLTPADRRGGPAPRARRC